MNLQRTSISQVTVGTDDFGRQIDAIAESGATGIGLFDWCFPDGIDAGEIGPRLAARGLRATICGGATSFILPTPFPLWPTVPSSLEDSVRETIESLERFAALEPACFAVITGGEGELDPTTARAAVIDGLGQVNERARHLGVPLALEPVHPQWGGFSIVSSIDAARELLDEIGDDNIGLLVDSFHVWDVDDVSGQLARAAGRITAVHLSDSATTPRSAADRLLPGDGVVDLRAFISAVEDAGFRGWYDFEVASSLDFADSFLRSSPESIARRCVDGFLRATTSESDL